MTSSVERMMFNACNIPVNYFDERFGNQGWSEKDLNMMREFVLGRDYAQSGMFKHIAIQHGNSTESYNAAIVAYYLLARSMNLDGCISYVTSAVELDNAIAGEWVYNANDCKINYYFVDDFIFCYDNIVNVGKFYAFLKRCTANNQAICFMVDTDIWDAENQWVWPRYVMRNILDNVIVLPFTSTKECKPIIYGE